VLIIAIIIALIGGGVWYWQAYLKRRDSKMPNGLRDAATRQEKAKLSDAEANKLNNFTKATDEINVLITEGKYTQAKAKIDTLAKDQASNSAVQDTIYGLYARACAGLVDIACMDKTLDHFKAANEGYFMLAVQFAEAASAANKTTEAKKYYQAALTVADKNGGQKFVDSVNKVSKERQYDYSQIKQGAS
jgi:hypothetical protein